MHRDRLPAIAAAVLGVIAIVVAAATLEDRWIPDQEGGSGDTGGGGLVPPPEAAPGEEITIPFIEELVMLIIALLVIVALIYIVREHREVIPILLGVVVITWIVSVLIDLLDPQPQEREPGETMDWLPYGTGGEEGEAPPPDAPVDWLPVTAIVGILGIVLVAAIVMSMRGGTPSVAPSDQGSSTEPATPVPEAIGAAAGRAADRIEASAGYENDVYRAWAEMTGLLDRPNADVATPGDFATAAVDAGLDPRDVHALTRLFEEVRYGDRPPTERRERRAVELFRRIEERYADG